MTKSERREAWEKLVQTGVLDRDHVSAAVAQWWSRAHELGANPYQPEPQVFLPHEDLEERRFVRREMMEALKPVLDNLVDTLSGNPYVLGVADDEGFLLEVRGDPDSLENAKNILMIPGANHQERYLGNNPVGTALFQKEPVYIQGGEHYCLLMKGWTTAGIPIRDRLGRVMGAVGLATPRRLASTNIFLTAVFAIQSVESRLITQVHPEMEGIREHFYRKSNLFITVLDREGRIRDFNRPVSAISGKPREELIGQYIWDVWYGGRIRNEKGEFVASSVESLMTGRYIRGREFHLRDKDGMTRWFIIDSMPIYDGEGRINGSMSILEDITERKYLESQIYRSEKLATMGQLAASLAHEIRNPLTVIQGFVQMLEGNYGDESMRDFIPLMMDELQRVNRLLNEFLLFAKPTAPVLVNTDLKELVDSVAEFMRGEASRRHCRIEISTRGECFVVRVDEQQMRQVFVNLIQNAIDASPDGHEVRIILDGQEERMVLIQIEDDGTGIPEENLAKVFDPFFTTKENGTGLGLYAVHRIIENHRGQVEAINRGGKGTTIGIRLPRP
jgi:two-component system, sporulation sensor kinase E